MQAQQYTAEPIAASTPAQAPEFFRLPARGGDPFFGLSRSFYYAAEKEGSIKMIRLRKAGAQRGVVLVPYAGVREYIRTQAAI